MPQFNDTDRGREHSRAHTQPEGAHTTQQVRGFASGLGSWAGQSRHLGKPGHRRITQQKKRSNRNLADSSADRLLLSAAALPLPQEDREKISLGRWRRVTSWRAAAFLQTPTHGCPEGNRSRLRHRARVGSILVTLPAVTPLTENDSRKPHFQPPFHFLLFQGGR